MFRNLGSDEGLKILTRQVGLNLFCLNLLDFSTFSRLSFILCSKISIELFISSSNPPFHEPECANLPCRGITWNDVNLYVVKRLLRNYYVLKWPPPVAKLKINMGVNGKLFYCWSNRSQIFTGGEVHNSYMY